MDQEALFIGGLSAIRAAEAAMIKAMPSAILVQCARYQARNGPGLLVVNMQVAPKVDMFWVIQDTCPEPGIAKMLDNVDIRHGIIAVMFLYSDQVAAYLLSTLSSPSYRDFTGLPFVLLERRIVANDPMEKRRAYSEVTPDPLSVRRGSLDSWDDL